MKALKFITTIALVTAAGVAVGMLFAPQKGSKTRRKISELNHEYSDYIADKYDDFIESVSHPVEDMEDASKRVAKKAKTEAKKVASNFNSELM